MEKRPRPERTDLTALRRRIERELDSLDWPTPFDFDGLLDQIGAKRGKPIGLFAAELPADGPGGLVIERADDLVIVFDDRLPPLQQEHIILHEAAHVLFGHRGTSLDDLGGEGLTELDPDVVEQAQRFAQRDGYSNAEEAEAEVAAGLMWLRVGAARCMTPPRFDLPEVAAANARFAAALTRRRRTT
ncbi:hypothetical protein F4560_007357 [Saccharothrix ecbatanensis]|jgi:hypothetical protein|uniref:IrrE N-terminal-like domain-containing protein n=1 Tax=Saccharothrix ecbatanensis TaxID=1105145 RepID=A0A7W9HSF0_9PSEU|nr:hypothetical protein [Saccharothrix ecbatanensis]MBB5807589.1 hypothetical protein [Saccharothrix ecbatanensis]